MATQIYVSIDSGNGLLPDSTEPLPSHYLYQCWLEMLLLANVDEYSFTNTDINLSGTETWMFQNKFNTMAADAQAPCVARPSAIKILNMQLRILFFQDQWRI